MNQPFLAVEGMSDVPGSRNVFWIFVCGLLGDVGLCALVSERGTVQLGMAKWIGRRRPDDDDEGKYASDYTWQLFESASHH